MSNKIVIAGGSGFIGRYLSVQLKKKGYQVLIISRHAPDINWNDKPEIKSALEGSSMLINLAGKSVNCRYNSKNKEEIIKSRTETTRALGEAILTCENPPALWINSSTATIYRNALDRPMTESNGEIGEGFSVNVALAWERAFYDFELPHTRQVALRMAIVLGKGGGVMQPLINLVRFGLGGRQGSGNQMFSWVHIEDLLNIILFLIEHTQLEGVYNVSSPNPVTNAVLMKTIRQKMRVKIGLPSPKWLLEIGAVFIKTETELVLKSRWVLPEKLLAAGYLFKFPTIETAIADITGA